MAQRRESFVLLTLAFIVGSALGQTPDLPYAGKPPGYVADKTLLNDGDQTAQTRSTAETLPYLEPEDLTLTGGSLSSLSFEINAGCNHVACKPENVNSSVCIANITIDGYSNEDRTEDDDPDFEYHYIWSVIKHPAIQVALSEPGDYSVINWSGIFGLEDLDSAVGYKEAPKYSAAVMLANLVEYDDVDNLGFLPLNISSEDMIVYPLFNSSWSRSVIESSPERMAMQFVAENFTYEGKHRIVEGKINLTLSAYGDQGFGHWLPHLSHSESTNQFDIQLDGLKTTSGFNHSRFALQFYVVSDAENAGSAELMMQSTNTLDDEHTPGIFKTQELIIPGYNNKSDLLQSYMQWRPVAYTTSARELSSSSDVAVLSPVRVSRPSLELNNTILYGMYGLDLEDMLVTKINITFGTKGDGFYKKTRFTAWTFTFGTGLPIHNGLSPALILALTVMFGILFIVLGTSAMVCLAKKCRDRNARYVRIQN